MSMHAPVGWEYQHGETGLITVCINDGVNDRDIFERLNPRHHYVGPLYRHPAVQVTKADFMKAVSIELMLAFADNSAAAARAYTAIDKVAAAALNPGGSRE